MSEQMVSRKPSRDEVTIAGTLDPSKGKLSDETGTIALMKRLPTAPGFIAVRGFLTTAPGGAKAFYVKRWAPLAQPPKSAPPLSIPSPPVRRPL